jgi:hypothetical protein
MATGLEHLAKPAGDLAAADMRELFTRRMAEAERLDQQTGQQSREQGSCGGAGIIGRARTAGSKEVRTVHRGAPEAAIPRCRGWPHSPGQRSFCATSTASLRL